MKFRALMNDSNAVKDFMSVVTSLSKIGRTCVIRMSQNTMYFIMSEEANGTNSPLVWCELPVTFYFKEYSVASEHNEIYLELSILMLSQALGTLRDNIRWLKLKLTNKQLPCLTVEIELVSDESIQNRQCVHDVPTEVIRHHYWDNYKKPLYDDFHVSIQMPPLKTMKHMVDKMKNMSSSLIVIASKNGRLTLRIKSTVVNLSAHFTNLSVESFDVGQIPTLKTIDVEDQPVSATVDIKKFLMFLTGMQLNNHHTTCSIVKDKMVKLTLKQPGALSMEILLPEVHE